MDEEQFPSISYTPPRISASEMIGRARKFAGLMATRRSVRMFSPDPIPQEVIELALHAAGSAPSGANLQPWKFVVVRDGDLKRLIRVAAEQEEQVNYSGRMPEDWLRALAPLQTDWRKEFLEIAPVLIVVFKEEYGLEAGRKVHHYYVNESVGIACGFLLAALHDSGLVSLTHTPSPMGFLREILGRPENEKPFLLIPVGFPADNCRVPDIRRKPSEGIVIWK
ncbi:MAG TPA: nitroreductase family protein [Thermoanaerobaculia bacterium]|nr:nitroreductase family protein [Thermoanaerobaculia bacterium]